MANARGIEETLLTARDAYDYEMQIVKANKQAPQKQLQRLGDLVNALQGLLYEAAAAERSGNTNNR